METKKINVKQLFTIFILGITSPIIRSYSVYLSQIGKEASWVGPIVGFIPIAILVYIIKEFYKKNPNESLENIMCDILGNFLGKVLLVIMLIWALLVVILNTRILGSRYVSSIYALSPIEFFVAAFLGVCFIISRGKMQYYARLCEILFIISLLTLGLSIILVLPEVDFSNLFPVTTLDASNILKMQEPIMGISAYMFAIFFIGSKFPSSEEIKKYGIKAAIVISLIGVLSIFVTVGIFSAEVTDNLTLPFSMAMKEINILEKVYGLESIFVSIWVISDIAIAVSGIYVVKNLLSKITKTEDNREFVTPIIFLVYILAMWIINNRYEYEFFFKEIVLKLDIALGYILPVILLIIGKIRKKI